MKTERRSPMMTRGVATPSVASNNIAVVIAIPATNPGKQPGVDCSRSAHDENLRLTCACAKRLLVWPFAAANAATTNSLCSAKNFSRGNFHSRSRHRGFHSPAARLVSNNACAIGICLQDCKWLKFVEWRLIGFPQIHLIWRLGAHLRDICVFCVALLPHSAQQAYPSICVRPSHPDGAR